MNFNTVFLTYGGWLPVVPGDTIHTTALPEWIGGCSVCWSPAIAVPASEDGECTCCGYVGPVLGGEDLILHEIRWNSSKHLPDGPGMSYRKHWELARLMNVQFKLVKYLATRVGGTEETPEWVKKVSEGFGFSPLGTREVQLTAIHGNYPEQVVVEKVLDEGCYAARLAALRGMMNDSTSFSARKAFLEKRSDDKDNHSEIAPFGMARPRALNDQTERVQMNPEEMGYSARRSARLKQMWFLKHLLDDHEGMAVNVEKIFNPDIHTIGEISPLNSELFNKPSTEGFGTPITTEQNNNGDKK